MPFAVSRRTPGCRRSYTAAAPRRGSHAFRRTCRRSFGVQFPWQIRAARREGDEVEHVAADGFGRQRTPGHLQPGKFRCLRRGQALKDFACDFDFAIEPRLSNQLLVRQRALDRHQSRLSRPAAGPLPNPSGAYRLNQYRRRRVLSANSPTGCSPKSAGHGRRLRARRGGPVRGHPRLAVLIQQRHATRNG
jgi:hypothetical protein